MRSTSNPKSLRRWPGIALTWVLAVGLVLAAVGCEGPLEVDNPNSLLEEDLENPAAANALVNGALVTASRGISYVLAPHNTVTDEGTWIGSRDAWQQLDFGILSDFNNEFVDAAWPFITEARWSADNAVGRLTQFDTDGTLPDRADLARAHLFAAMVRVYIADWFDDFVFSNKKTAMPPIGESNMATVYDQAIDQLGKGLTVAQAIGDAELQRRILALRARAKHAKAVWQKLNPKGSTPSDPYVNAGADDATAALAMMDDAWRWQLEYSPSTTANEWSFEVNSRQELAILDQPNDPIDDIADPRIAAAIEEFTDRSIGDRYNPLTVVSAREMHLIIAEARIASGDLDGAKTHINAVRAPDGLSPWTDQDAKTILEWERRANLFMQGRRLADMYRFGTQSPNWISTSDAVRTPGTFFPITIQERRANPFVGG